MGCGSSKNQVVTSSPQHTHNGHIPNGDTSTKHTKPRGTPHGTPQKKGLLNNAIECHEDGPKVRSPTPIPKDEEARNVKNRPLSTDTNGNRHDVIVETHEVPKAIAFDVELENQNSLIKKHPPKRFQKLAPLEGATKLTADMLEEKLKSAESKRQNELEKVVSASRRSSKRRRELVQAKEFEKAQQQYTEIEDQQRSAGKNREARQQQIIEKQKLREERARRARERVARQQRMEEEDLNLEVEKDDNFNADDDENWIDDGSMAGDIDEDSEDHIYSGRSSPKKALQSRQPFPNSASTLDSYDKAILHPATSNKDHTRDDFFDDT